MLNIVVFIDLRVHANRFAFQQVGVRRVSQGFCIQLERLLDNMHMYIVHAGILDSLQQMTERLINN